MQLTEPLNIVVLDAYVANPGDLSWAEVAQLGRLTIYDRTPPELVCERARNAHALLVNKVALNADTLAALPQLRYIGVLATGYNIVDIDAAHRRGITVTNVPAYSTASVAQLTMAHLLNICCQVQHYTTEVRNGLWSRCPDFSFTDTRLLELSGKRLGVVGFGQIGSAVAKIALALGMRVSAFTSKSADRLPPDVDKAPDLDTLLAHSDVVTLHCPLTATTRHLIDARRLALFKHGAILLNTARGPLVDEQALTEALRSGHLLAAGLDVMALEPPAADNPLLREPGCYITPHIAWASEEARRRLMDIVAQNLRAFTRGTPQNVV